MEFFPGRAELGSWDREAGPETPLLSDIEFLLRADVMGQAPREALCFFLNCLKREVFKAGARLISQGEAGDRLFLIQSGRCLVRVEKEGRLHVIAKLSIGDVVGEMAVVTGEPRGAHVDAETEVRAWSLSREDFESAASGNPRLRMLLTELVARRFETSPITAERRVGKYVIKSRLDKGGWGIVYRAVHKDLGMDAAMKMMRHDMAMNPAFLDQFRREAKAVARLRHENIVQVHDIDEVFNTVFIAMEFLDGRSLKKEMELTGPMDQAKMVDYLIQICQGLNYAHKKGVVHRDIKPANIFVCKDGRIKLLDFGLACSMGVEDRSAAGTISYISPEQIKGEPVDGRSDIFSLGVTAYEMATGQTPFPKADPRALIYLYCEEDIPDPGELAPHISGDLKRFITKACRRNPAKRYQDLDQALRDLQSLAWELAVREKPSPRPSFWKSRRKLLLFGGAALALAILGGLALVQAPGGPSVARTWPASGDRAVAPGLVQIRIGFSSPMKRTSWSVVETGPGEFPEPVGTPFFEGPKTFVLPVRLKPGTRYSLGVNGPNAHGFVGADEDEAPCRPFVLEFSASP